MRMVNVAGGQARVEGLHVVGYGTPWFALANATRRPEKYYSDQNPATFSLVHRPESKTLTRVRDKEKRRWTPLYTLFPRSFISHGAFVTGFLGTIILSSTNTQLLLNEVVDGREGDIHLTRTFGTPSSSPAASKKISKIPLHEWYKIVAKEGTIHGDSSSSHLGVPLSVASKLELETRYSTRDTRPILLEAKQNEREPAKREGKRGGAKEEGREKRKTRRGRLGS